MESEKMINELSTDQFRSTMASGMSLLNATATPAADIWPYVELLVRDDLVSEYVYKNQLVESVYRAINEAFDHVLLPTSSKNVFIIIVVDINHAQVTGHHRLDLEKEYGIEKQ